MKIEKKLDQIVEDSAITGGALPFLIARDI